MRAYENVYMCRHHPDLERMCPLLTRDAADVRAEELGEARVDETGTITRGPCDQVIQSMPHWDERALRK